MRNILTLGILMSSCLLTSTIQAGGATEAWGFAPETSLYLGAGLGVTSQNQLENNRSSAGKVYGGIRYRAIGAEVAYLQNQDSDFAGSIGRNAANMTSQTSGLSAAIMGYMPTNVRTEIIGKLGAVYWNQNNDSSTVDFQADSNERAVTEDSGLSPLLGIGAQYKLYQNMSVRGEWERIFSTGEGYYESDIDMLSLGINMSTL